jgi:hypothetical protein
MDDWGFSSQTGGMRSLGYTRVSTVSQDARLQLDALTAAGVEPRDVFSDVTSGARTAITHPGMKKLLDYADGGDTVVVWRIDRLGRSLIDVLNTVNLLRETRREGAFHLRRDRPRDLIGADDARDARDTGRVRAGTDH